MKGKSGSGIEVLVDIGVDPDTRKPAGSGTIRVISNSKGASKASRIEALLQGSTAMYSRGSSRDYYYVYEAANLPDLDAIAAIVGP